MKNKTRALFLVGAFAAIGAMAQQTTPPGAAVPPATPGYVTSPEAQQAEMKKDMRAPGEVQKPTTRSTMTHPIQAQGKSATQGARNKVKREAKHPNRMAAEQGVTPESPGAK